MFNKYLNTFYIFKQIVANLCAEFGWFQEITSMSQQNGFTKYRQLTYIDLFINNWEICFAIFILSNTSIRIVANWLFCIILCNLTFFCGHLDTFRTQEESRKFKMFLYLYNTFSFILYTITKVGPFFNLYYLYNICQKGKIKMNILHKYFRNTYKTNCLQAQINVFFFYLDIILF